MRRREIEMVGKKVSFAEAEKEEITQWQNTSFEDKWKSLELMRKLFYNFHSLPFSDKVERVIKKVKNGIGQ